MAYMSFTAMASRRDKQSFTDSLAQQKHNSLAQKALHDLIIFNEALEEEMQQLLASSSQGHIIDNELLAKMITVKEKYLTVLHGLKHYDDQEEHLALIVYADAVQDLIRHLSQQKRH